MYIKVMCFTYYANSAICQKHGYNLRTNCRKNTKIYNSDLEISSAWNSNAYSKTKFSCDQIRAFKMQPYLLTSMVI